MMDTAGKYQYCRRQFRQALQDVCNPIQHECLDVAFQDIFFFDDYGRETVHGTHFGSRQNDTPNTANRTDIDLMALRYQHARMDDVPGAAGRRRIFQTGRKGLWKLGIADPEPGRWCIS